MFPTVPHVLNGPIGSAGPNFGRQSIPGSNSDFSSTNSYLNRSHGSASSTVNSVNAFRDLTGRGLEQVGSGTNAKDALFGLSSNSNMSSAATALSSQSIASFLGPAPDRNGGPTLLANCRSQQQQQQQISLSTGSNTTNMGTGSEGATVLSDVEFPSLGRISSLNNPAISSFSNFTTTTTPTTSYQPPMQQTAALSSTMGAVPSHHVYNKDVINALQRAPYANLMKTAALENVTASGGASLGGGASEFHIVNEDFPALPGANNTSSTSVVSTTEHHPSSHPVQSSLSSSGGTNMDGWTADSRYSRDASAAMQQQKTGIQTLPNGRVTGIPAGMLNDQFGMAGLLTFLRAIENDPNIVALALGHDLTTLGLNLNAPEKNLYATFGGPWSEQPCRVQEMDTKVPEEYLTNASIRDKLPNIKLNKLAEDVLFYLFYNCAQEVYQMAAACELYSRDWRFHKRDGVWLTRSQYGGVKEQTGSYEMATYNVFDPIQWRKIPKEMTLEYKDLEERPKLPAQLTSQTPSSTGIVPANAGGGPGPS